MNFLQKSYHAFIESVCTKLGCSEMAHPLQEGFTALVESVATAKLAKYLNQPATVNVKASSRTDLSQPAYNYFTDAREVTGVWAVHFTGLEAFEDIQESGFKNGTATLDNLAYSANYSDSKRDTLGWLFALPIDCHYLDNYDLGYGDCGFLIKTNGVRARHIVDGDDEILFRGSDVLEKIPIIFDEDYDKWVAYLTDDKKLQNRSLKKLIQSVMKSLGCSEPAHPLQESFSAMCNLDIDEVMLQTNFGAHGEPEYQDPDYTERVAYVKRVIGAMKFPLRVWRALKLYPGKELRLGNELGRYWTYNHDMFYRNKSEQWFANGKWNVILTGTVTEDQVNWDATITALAGDYNPETGGASPNAECEICLKRDCIPSELEIDTDLR